jgi:ribosomal protein S18 acetylase RimI-like enzyme
MTDLDIRPLTDDTWQALSELFAEGGEPRWCWCAFWRTSGAGGSRSEVDSNRAMLGRLASGPGAAPGLVALHRDRAVGWVSFAPRAELPRLARSHTLAPVDDRPVWSIVCFVVSRSVRGQGVAAALLAAAVDYAREHGATTIEAYPRDTAGERLPASSLNTGAPGMFERAGFTVVATRKATPNARSRLIMRLELNPRKGRPGRGLR